MSRSPSTPTTPGALSSFWRDVLVYVHPGPPGVDLPAGADPLAAWDDFLARGGEGFLAPARAATTTPQPPQPEPARERAIHAAPGATPGGSRPPPWRPGARGAARDA